MRLSRLPLPLVAIAAVAPAVAWAQDQPRQTTPEQAAQSPQEQPEGDRDGPPPAAAADLAIGTQVFGGDGKPVGTIESTDGGGAVVTTGSARGRLNLDAFYKSEKGLLIGYNRAEFEAMAGGDPAPSSQ